MAIRRKKRPAASPRHDRNPRARIGHNQPPLPEGARFIGYARVSTEEQDLSMQLSALQRAGVHEDNLWYEKVSGVKKRRPQRDLALMDAREGDVIVVYKLDRLGRSFRELLAIIDDLKDRKIGFKSLNDPIDTTNATGMLMFHILGACAEFERALTVERTRDGMAEAKRQGRQVGAPLFMTPARMKEATKRLTAGESIASIASEWNISRQTLYVRFSRSKIARLRRVAAKKKRRR